MTEHERMNAAPSVLHFVDGTEYRISPLTDRDLTELDEWVRIRYIRLVISSLPPDTPAQECADLRIVAAREAMKLTWMSGAGAQQVATIDGLTRLAWQMIRREHPNVTVDELRKHLFDAGNVAELRMQFRRLNLPEGPTRPGKRRAKRKSR